MEYACTQVRRWTSRSAWAVGAALLISFTSGCATSSVTSAPAPRPGMVLASAMFAPGMVAADYQDYTITLDESVAYFDDVANLMILRLSRDGQWLGGSGGSYRSGNLVYEFRSGVPFADYPNVAILFDMNGDYLPDDGEMILRPVTPRWAEEPTRFEGPEVAARRPDPDAMAVGESQTDAPPPVARALAADSFTIRGVARLPEVAWAVVVLDETPEFGPRDEVMVGIRYVGGTDGATGEEMNPLRYGINRFGFDLGRLPKSGPFDLQLGFWARTGEPLSTITWEEISVAELEAGIGDTRADLRVQFDSYDLAGKPAPPEPFRFRPDEYGVQIIDLNYNEPLWIHPTNSRDDVLMLFPDAQIEDGRIFRLADGGFVVTSYRDDGSLRMWYPRGTTRFTIPGAPPLPWDRADLFARFGIAAARAVTDEPSVQFVGANTPQTPGFRLDTERSIGTGFRILFEE